MTNSISIDSLANDIRILYQSNPLKSEALIENYLEEGLKGMAGQEIAVLEALTSRFKTPGSDSVYTPGKDKISLFLAGLLGGRVQESPLGSTECLEKLTQSLNTIFDTLNKIIATIHTILLGEEPELKTIRTRMRDVIQGEGELSSIQVYLDRIQKSFLVAHKAFQHAACAKMEEVLIELDPDRLQEPRGGFKIGPLRKAELFETYKDKFLKCYSWFHSKKFSEELLREFEKTCQRLYHTE